MFYYLYFSFTVKNNHQEKLRLGTLFQSVHYLSNGAQSRFVRAEYTLYCPYLKLEESLRSLKQQEQ